MANRISVIIDVATRNAESALKNFTKGVREAEGATGKLKAGFTGGMEAIKSSGILAGAAFGVLVKGAGDAIRAASDLAESTNAVNVSFGHAAQAVHKLGEDSVDSMGLSERAFNEAAVGMSAFAKTAAGSGGDVAGTLEQIMLRATDFASVMNLDVSEAMDVFRSALSGEQEPIKRFGIDMSAAAVEAYALASGMVKSKSEMTEAVKVQARYQLLLEKTSNTAGDFQNTSDGLANSQRKLKANVENLYASIGKELTPAVEDAVGNLNGLIGAWKALENSGPVQLILKLTGQDSTLGFLDKVASYANPIGLTKNALEDFGGYWDRAFGNVDKHTESLESNAGAMVQASIESALLAQKQKDVAKAAEDAAQADEDAQAAREKLTDAVEDAREKTEALHDAVLASIDSSLGFRNAQADAGEALVDYAAKAADGSTTTAELDQAQRDAEGAILNTAAAAVKLAEDQAAANGETLTAEEKAAIYRQTLQDLAAYTDGPLRAALDGYIGTLGRIPPTVMTRIQASVPRVVIDPEVRGAAGFGTVTVGATGGIVNRPTMALIGEAGPEAVVPLDKSPGNGPLPKGLGGAGGDVNITINSADPNMVINALRQYFRTGSKPTWWPT